MFKCCWEGTRDRFCRFGGKKERTSFLMTSVYSVKYEVGSTAEGQGTDGEVGGLRKREVRKWLLQSMREKAARECIVGLWVSTKGLVEAGDHEFIVAQICEVE